MEKILNSGQRYKKSENKNSHLLLFFANSGKIAYNTSFYDDESALVNHRDGDALRIAHLQN